MKNEKRRMKDPKYRLAAAVFLLAASAALTTVSAKMPGVAEWYSERIYPALVSVIGRVSAFFPFSLAEILLYLLLIVFAASFLCMAVRLAKSRRRENGEDGEGAAGKRDPAKDPGAARIVVSWLSGVLLAAGVLAFLYTACCGINYHRQSFSEEEQIDTYPYRAEDLEEVCLWLTEEVNALCAGAPEDGGISRDENGVMRLEGPEQDEAVRSMYALAEEYPSLEGYYPRPKKLIVSEILSYQSLTGVYSPFTVEANYNGDMTSYNIPFTACHELSHLRGFMQEQEANFIAFLACIGSERADFRYSGFLSGWVYCMNALYRADPESWAVVRVLLDPAAEPDLAANNAFWDRYEGAIADTADKINDTYLKVNGQADGVKSYGRMVDLMVAWRLGDRR